MIFFLFGFNQQTSKYGMGIIPSRDKQSQFARFYNYKCSTIQIEMAERKKKKKISKLLTGQVSLD